MAQVTFQLCDNETDLQAAYVLFQLNWTENGYPAPPESKLRERYDAQELCVGKDGNEVVAFFQFHKADEIEVGLGTHLIIYVMEAYRTMGVAASLLNFGRVLMKERGITHLEVWSFPRPDVQALVSSRGLTLDRTEEYEGILYEVYRMTY